MQVVGSAGEPNAFANAGEAKTVGGLTSHKAFPKVLHRDLDRLGLDGHREIQPLGSAVFHDVVKQLLNHAVDRGVEFVVDLLKRPVDRHLHIEAVSPHFSGEVLDGSPEAEVVEACWPDPTDHAAGILEPLPEAVDHAVERGLTGFRQRRVGPQPFQQHRRAHDILDQAVVKLMADQLPLVFLQLNQAAEEMFAVGEIAAGLLHFGDVGGDASHGDGGACCVANRKLHRHKRSLPVAMWNRLFDGQRLAALPDRLV